MKTSRNFLGYTAVLLLGFSLFFSSCKKEEEPASNVENTHVFTFQNEQTAISVTIGEKDGEKWISSYHFETNFSSKSFSKAPSANYSIKEVKSDLKGIQKFENEVVTINLNSSTLDKSKSYLKILLRKNEPDAVTASYSIFIPKEGKSYANSFIVKRVS